MTQFVPLGEVADFRSGGTPQRSNAAYFMGKIPWITGADIGDDGKVSPRSFITPEAISRSATNEVPAGTVLLVTRTSVGKTAVAPYPLTFSQDVTALLPNPKTLDGGYLRHFLRETSQTLISQARGATIKGVTRDAVESLKIRLPSLTEQRWIAAVLDQADELRAKRGRTVSLLGDLERSIFHDMFMKEPQFERSCLLGEVAEIVSGITKGRKLPGGVSLREVPYLAVANVQDKQLDLSAVKIIEAGRAEIDRYRLLKDDLLLTEGGDPDKLGRGTLWNEEIPEAIHQNHIFRVRLNKDSRVNPVYLNWYVGSDVGKRYFIRSAKQTTGIASINASQLKNFPLQIPSLPLQESFASRIAEIREAKAAQQVSFQTLDELFASLQVKAFRGEL